LPASVVGGTVAEEQMFALFGLGRHPNDRAIARELMSAGASLRVMDGATKLGHAYHGYEPSKFQAALAARYREHNTARGARADAAIPARDRSRIRTVLAHEWFRRERGRDPLDGREFTGYLTRVSRPAPMPVAGYDLTFSPVKSVSTLRAIAPRDLAATIAACHDEAVRDTISWLPRLEALLTERVGVRFADRGDAADAQREVREILGIDDVLLRRWSSRRGDIEAELPVLARRFQDEHGRPPTVIERRELAQQATLATREAKHEPRSEAEQRSTWTAEASEILGGARQVRELVRRATGHAPAPTPSVDVDVLAEHVISTVQASRATWQEHHLRAEAERACRRLAAVPEFLVDAVTHRALSPANSVLLTVRPIIDEPPELRRADGSSVYEVAGSRRYTSAAILDAERRILDGASCQDFRIVESGAVDMALLEAVANGARLGPDQAEMVRQLATSGARVQLAIAPAGSGKTVSLRTLADAWAADGSTVIGLAPTAAAARVLRDELGKSVTATDTLAKLAHALTTATAVPEWVDAITPGSLVIVDEAGWPAPSSWPPSSTTPLRTAHPCGSSATTGNSPPSAPAACCATSTAPTARSGCLRCAASPTPTAALTAPKPPPRWRSDAARRPDSGTTSTTAASRSATTQPQRIRPSPPGRPTVQAASTHCSSRPPTNRSGS
jgi:hypothetical protein